MDFKLVFENLLTGFDKYNVRYGLIGGFALGLYGVSRSTMDLDFLVHLDDMPKIDNIMQELGYERSFRSENVSQFISPLKVFGEIDFIHAFRETSLKMLQRAEGKRIFNNLSVKVLKLEDIIGFNVKIPMINEKEKHEGIEIMQSQSLREDMRNVAAHGENSPVKNRKVDVDQFIEFVTTFNDFVNHIPKPFKPIADKNMKL
jgi:hypothetical protein